MLAQRVLVAKRANIGDVRAHQESLGDEFVEPFLRFRIVKPPGWSFVPAAWSPFAQLRNAAGADVAWLQHANQPFVCFVKKHDSERHVQPSVQVTARPSGIPPSDIARQILDAQIKFVEETFDALEVISATTDRIVAGYRANSMVARYRFLTDRDGEEREFEVLARSLSIFTPGLAFSVGMTSSVDPEYYKEEEFHSVVRSMTIG